MHPQPQWPTWQRRATQLRIRLHNRLATSHNGHRRAPTAPRRWRIQEVGRASRRCPVAEVHPGGLSCARSSIISPVGLQRHHLSPVVRGAFPQVVQHACSCKGSRQRLHRNRGSGSACSKTHKRRPVSPMAASHVRQHHQPPAQVAPQHRAEHRWAPRHHFPPVARILTRSNISTTPSTGTVCTKYSQIPTLRRHPTAPKLLEVPQLRQSGEPLTIRYEQPDDVVLHHRPVVSDGNTPRQRCAEYNRLDRSAVCRHRGPGPQRAEARGDPCLDG